MGKYLIKTLPTDECNEEFAPDKCMQDGEECDGYMLIMFEDNEPSATIMQQISVKNIKDLLTCDCKVATAIRQACAIAEGEIKAVEIQREMKRKDDFINVARRLGIAPQDD